jgi:hypothetical protein
MPFRLLEKIGEGKFADIYKIKDEKGKTFAFKAVPANKLKYIEMDILARLRSPYIIRSIDPKITHFSERYGIVEQLEDNDLTKLKISKLPYVQLKRIIISAIYGLRCMHKKGFLHLDVSRRNILYGKDNEENYCAYLTDFGWSVRCNNAYKGIMSTKVIKYKNTPIEVLDASKNKEGVKLRKYSDKSDIWSMGIVIMELLGARFHFDETETYVKHMKSITDSFIEEKIRHYNDKKMSNNEELYLKELLVNMLKIDVAERISSKDITRLKFFKTTNRLLNLSEDCVLEKPTELVFLPYISPLTTDGIKKIRNYYLNNSAVRDCITIDEYFLAIQVFLRLMSKTKPYINEEELQELAKEAVYVASNYYDRRSDQGSYKVAEDLKSEIGYNFYYSADYLEDLIILNHYITDGNKDLLGFYNLFNIKKLFEFFREGYNYKNRKRNSVSLHEFLEMEIPTKKDNEEVSFLTALDYHEIIAEDESYSLVKKYKDIEKDFRVDIIDKFESRIIKVYEDDDLNIIEVIDKMIDNKKYIEKYEKLKKNLLNKNIAKTLQDINQYFKYGIINIDMYGKVDRKKGELRESKDKEEIKYFVVKNNERYSLLVRSTEDPVDESLGMFHHYYSEKNTYLKNELEDYGYKYKNIFDYGINSCCKILELCIIFVIYYNLKTGKNDYHLKCLDYDTIKGVLMVLMI